MRRVLAFLLRNWPLKLGAVLLATVLYSGLVLSQNVRTHSGPVPIEPIRQPPEVALLTELPAINLVRYRAPIDVVVSPNTFSATVDLSRVQARPGGEPVAVPVTVLALDARVQVVGYEPNVVQVVLDPVQSRTMRVTVERGTVPEGLTLGPEQIEPQTVAVRGPSTRVAAIRSVVARVAVDASALNVDREVDLIAIDEQGNLITNVDIEPARARVRIAVARQLATRTLPVVPQLIGDPPNGLRLAAVEVAPAAVTISGDETLVAPLDGVSTEPIDLAARTRDFELDVTLQLPDGVTVSGGSQVRVSVTLAEDGASRTLQVGLALSGTRPGFDYAIGASQIVVTLGGTIAALEGVNGAALSADVDVSELDAGRHLVPVNFTPPAGLQLVSLAPAEVLVLVTEVLPPETESPTGGRFSAGKA
ncbi:MAG TPA: CdaR family protein [Candidatus Limnocylindrales bacterium]|nr:CdaR family protein [Candidatus Limnocylindrales bacterium]